MKRLQVAAAVLVLISSSAIADTINMKSGDVYHADVLQEEFGKYVQILLKDGNEKRLQWMDIESIDRTKPTPPATPVAADPIPNPTAAEAVSPKQPPTESSAEYATQSLNTEKLARFDFDLVGVSYDMTWQKASLQINGGSPSVANITNRYFRTAPLEFTLGSYLGRWHFYLEYLNAPTNTNDVGDTNFTTFAPTFAVLKNFDIGLMLAFNFSSTAGGSSQLSGSDYIVGPYFRVVAPVADTAAIEISGGAGLDFRDATISNSSGFLSGSDTAFYAKLRVEGSVSLFKQISYVTWVDGWVDLGTYDGNEVSGGTVKPGSLQDDIYRVRLVPIGVRLKF